MGSDNYTHPALNLEGSADLVYTAMSKTLFYFRSHISKFVLEQGKVPLNPFSLFDYFLLDTVDRDVVRTANNSLVMRADEVWVFGPVSDGVLSEILISQDAGKPIRYYSVHKAREIIAIQPDQIEMESDVGFAEASDLLLNREEAS